MGATLTTLSSILKEFYLKPVQEQLNQDVLITQILKVDSENLEGLKAVVPLHTARSGGIGARGELVLLPTAGNQAYARAEYDLKYHYARVQVSGPSISKTKSEAGAFLQALKSELDYIKQDVMLDQSRQLYGDGSATVATIGTGVASATQPVTNDEAILRGFLYVGMVVDIGTAASPAARGTRTITDIDVSVPNIVLDSSVTTTTSDLITRSGNKINATTIYEMDCGLTKVISTSANTVGGINAAAAGSRYWDNLRDASGGAISLDNLQLNWNKVSNAGGKSGEVVAVTTPGIVRRLFATADFKSNVRFVNSQVMKGGFEQITFSAGSGQIEMNADRLAPRSKVHFVHKKHVRVFSPADWDFLSRDGQTIRWVSDYDAFQAVLFRYANLGAERRNTSLVMSGITDTDF